MPNEVVNYSYAYNWHEYFQSDIELGILSQLSPHQKLVLACIDRAIRDFKDAPLNNFLNWYFFEENSSDRAFSFYWCCGELNLTPNKIIKDLTKYKEAVIV